MDETASEDFEEAFPGMFLVAFHVTYRVLGDVTRAEDAASEALARALVSWRRVGQMEHRNGWVARVAGNVAIDEISVNSVKKHAARGKETLRARLGPTQEVSLALD